MVVIVLSQFCTFTVCSAMSMTSPSAFRSGISIQSPTRSMRSEEHTSELQSLMRISYAVFCLKKKNKSHTTLNRLPHHHNTAAHIHTPAPKQHSEYPLQTHKDTNYN